MSRIRTVATVAYSAILCLSAAGAAYYLSPLPKGVDLVVIGGSGAVMGGIIAVLNQMLGKLDRVQQDADKFEASRATATGRYLRSLRRRMLALFVATLVCGGFNTALAVALGKEWVTDVAAGFVVPLAYGFVVAILLFAIRIVGVYLALDEFRDRLVRMIQNEEKRTKDMLELRPSKLTPFPRAKAGSV